MILVQIIGITIGALTGSFIGWAISYRLEKKNSDKPVKTEANI